METEEKFLNKDYIKIRVNELNSIKNGTYFYEIEESDRANSNSIYVTFYKRLTNGMKIKGKTLRISDHKGKDPNVLDFLVKPAKELTKGRKVSFGEMLRGLEKRSADAIGSYILKLNTKIIGGDKNGR